MDIRMIIELVGLLCTGSALYWKMHYGQKEVKNTMLAHDAALIECSNRIGENETKLAEFKIEVERRFHASEAKIERRLTRIEKILIKIDERLRTQAAGELVEED